MISPVTKDRVLRRKLAKTVMANLDLTEDVCKIFQRLFNCGVGFSELLVGCGGYNYYIYCRTRNGATRLVTIRLDLLIDVTFVVCRPTYSI